MKKNMIRFNLNIEGFLKARGGSENKKYNQI